MVNDLKERSSGRRLPSCFFSIYTSEHTTKFPSERPKSFTVSVFPVPAGPAGAPPSDIPNAWERVM